MSAWWGYPGDRELRYLLYAPLLQNLYEDRLIVRERFIGIVKVEKAVITPERFNLTLKPLLCIKGNPRYDANFFSKSEWDCGAMW